jgi:hypothetical protein
MTRDMTAPSDHELSIRDQLRAAALSEIQRRKLTRDELGVQFGLPSVIAEALTARSATWSVETAMRVADALDIRWDVTIERVA